MFFVISGYLITSIILSSSAAGQFTVSGFYRRRIQRIFPALILVVGFTLAAGWFVLLPLEYAAVGKHAGAASVFIPNIVLWSEAGYFDVDSMRKPLLHLWSLGVEEQFYVLWPLILIVTVRMKVAPLIVVVALLCTSFAMSIAAISDQASSFFLPQYRVWELLLGAVLSALHQRPDMPKGILSKTGGMLATVGIGLMCLATFVITKERAFPGWWALLPTVGSALVIASSPANWVNRTILGNPVMVFIGKISFPLYLWHWPLLSMARIAEVTEPSIKIRLSAVAVSVLLAWLTHEFVEKKLRYHPSKILPYGLFASLLVLGALGMAVSKLEGVPSRTEALNEKSHQFLWQENGYFKQFNCPKGHGRKKYCLYNGKEAQVAVLGDSHSGNAFVSLVQHYKNSQTGVVRLAQPNCPPLFNVTNSLFEEADKCLSANNGNINWVIQNTNIHTVYLSSMGPMYLLENSPRYRMASLDNPELNSHKAIFAAGLRASVERLIKAGKNVVVVVDWPGLSYQPKECLDLRPFRLTKYQQHPCTMPREHYEKKSKEYRQILFSLAEEFPSLLYWNTVPVFCGKKVCHAMHEGRILYRDPGHLSIWGSQYLGERLELSTAQQILALPTK